MRIVRRQPPVRVPGFLVALVLAFTIACSRGPGPGPVSSPDPSRPLPSPIPDVVARVNGQPVRFASLVPMAKLELDRASDREKARPGVMRAALERYITRELLYQEAEARGIRADDAAVEQAYNQSRLRHPREEDWVETLQTQGFDPSSFRTELRIQVVLAGLGEQEARKAKPVTDEEAEAFYNSHQADFRMDQVVVRHILLHILPASTEQQIGGKRAQAQGLLFRIERGEKLSELARQFSDDLASRDRGGELPEFGRGQTDPAFEAAAFALKPGEHSGIVESSAGLHILELVSRQPGGLPPYESVAPELKERLLKDRRADMVKQLEARLRAKARIEKFL